MSLQKHTSVSSSVPLTTPQKIRIMLGYGKQRPREKEHIISARHNSWKSICDMIRRPWWTWWLGVLVLRIWTPGPAISLQQLHHFVLRRLARRNAVTFCHLAPLTAPCSALARTLLSLIVTCCHFWTLLDTFFAPQNRNKSPYFPALLSQMPPPKPPFLHHTHPMMVVSHGAQES